MIEERILRTWQVALMRIPWSMRVFILGRKDTLSKYEDRGLADIDYGCHIWEPDRSI